MKKIAIVWHSMTGGSEALAKAAAKGAARSADIELQMRAAADAQPSDILDADALLFIFPENLAAISGVMKAFFDRCYYPCLGRLEGRPYALIVCAGSDGSNAVRQAERIATGWRLRKIADSLIVCTHAQTAEAILAPKQINTAQLIAAHDMGAAIAEGMALGVF